MLDVARRTYPTDIDQLPAWLATLPGYDTLIPSLRDHAPAQPAPDQPFEIHLALPQRVAAHADDVDPLVWLVVLAYARARIDDKMLEVVRAARERNRSWTQIGECLGMTKQAAWERYSPED